MPVTIEQQPSIQINTKTSCYHCGEDCKEEIIQLEDKPFCCEGCKMVYEVLNANDLFQFYQIEEKAGVTLKGQQKKRYAWLDDAEVVRQLIDFEDERVTKVTFHLPQIHCASCLWLLENLYKLNDAIVTSRVNFLKKEVYITFEHEKTSLRSVVELLALIGYAPNIQMDKLDNDQRPTVDRKLTYQMGLAAFTFGNIMLLSFPEYLGLGDSVFQLWFGYLNILIIIPTIFYSAQHYLKSAWFGLKQGNLNIDVPIALGILTLFGRSIFEILSHTGAGYLDSLAGLILFLLAGRWFQQKTYHHLSFERDYKSYFPVAATIVEDDKMTSVALNKLKIGDRVLIRNQEIIPSDGVLVEGRARIDYSFVTGESAPISKNIGEKIFAGGRQIGTGIEVLVTKKVNQSYLVQLWNEDAFQKKTTPHASELANKVGKYFTYTILLIALATLVYWLPKDMGLAFNAFTAVLIIACPCAVALSIPFTLGNIMRILAKHGFYIKNTQVIENIQQANTIVFDKTGTLTDAQNFEVKYQGTRLSEEEQSAIAALTHESNHPLSKAIFQNLIITNTSKPLHFEEVEGYGLIGHFKKMEIKLGSSQFVNASMDVFSQEGGTVFVKINDTIKGYFTILPKYRKGLSTLFDYFKKFAQVHLLSGDNDNERANLQAFFKNNHLHFQKTPKEKLDYIQSLQDTSQKVVMLGDGLNDAGALRQSDVGIVISENTNNFTPACDAILEAKQFQRLGTYMKLAKGSIRLVYWSYGLAFVYNAIGLAFAVQGLLSPLVAAVLMPLSSITIVVFGVVSSSVYGRRVLKN